MSDKEIKVPNIGEFKDVEVIELLVSPGKKILKNDPLITIESDKSSVEIPSPFEGMVKSVSVKVGDKVSEGNVILVVESQSEKILENQIQVNEVDNQTIKEDQIIKKTIKKDTIKKKILEKASASPKVRKFARDLGININKVIGTERKGRIIEEDIKKFVSSEINKTPEFRETQDKKNQNSFSHSDFGEVEVKNIPRVKKLAANYLINSWRTIPHVTNHDEADITEIEDFRNSFKDNYTGEKKK